MGSKDQSLYFKVVRADGGEWANPAVKYVDGQTVKAKGRRRRNPSPYGTDVLRAYTNPAAANARDGWPRRLLVVSGDPIAGPDGTGECLFRRLTVTGELPVSTGFGPGGPDVVRVLNGLWTITGAEARALAEACDKIPNEDWWEAWLVSDLEGELLWPNWWEAIRWTLHGVTATVLHQGRVRDSAVVWAWSAAADSARYATRGLSVQHLIGHCGITQKHVDTLLYPWVTVMGDPREALEADPTGADLASSWTTNLEG